MPKSNEQLAYEQKAQGDQIKVLNDLVQRTNNSGVIGNSSFSSRRELQDLIDTSHRGNRKLYDIFGYEKRPLLKGYVERYQRQDIAARVVDAFPKACWSKAPKVTDDTDTQSETPFEKEFMTLTKDRRLKLMHYIRRVDILAGLGHYGVLYIAVNDGKEPDTPLEGTIKLQDILFIWPYTEINAPIAEFEENTTNPRYGLPTIYNLSAGTFGVSSKSRSSALFKGKPLRVHHSRVIHVAEGLLENDVIGTPRLESVLNRLVDLEKIAGGGSEMFFQNARGGLHMNQDPNTNLVNAEALEENISDFTHSNTRILQTKGIVVTPINFDIADPKEYFNMLIALISAGKGIPKRILTGSEQGQLASSQDENNWLARVMERQMDFCEVQLLRPLIDWFIERGVLPAPLKDSYEIVWTDLKTLSDKEKAEIAAIKSKAMLDYLNSGAARVLMPPEQYSEELLDEEYRPADLANPEDFDELPKVDPLDVDDGQES